MRLIDLDSDYIQETLYRRGFKTRQDIEDWLNFAQTIDAVPVVRCRECKFGTHFGDMEDEWIRCMNLHGNPLMPFDGFCSYGERREGDD